MHQKQFILYFVHTCPASDVARLVACVMTLCACALSTPLWADVVVVVCGGWVCVITGFCPITWCVIFTARLPSSVKISVNCLMYLSTFPLVPSENLQCFSNEKCEHFSNLVNLKKNYWEYLPFEDFVIKLANEHILPSTFNYTLYFYTNACSKQVYQ